MSRIHKILASIAIVIIVLDQITKQIALDALGVEGMSVPFVKFWNWTLVHNHGAAFGMLRNLPDSIRVGFFICLPFVVLTLLYFTYVKKFSPEERLGPVAIGLVFGGALGNLIDRIRFGYVIDFVDWYYIKSSTGKCLPQFFSGPGGTCHWPVFNVADSAITCAMTLLIIQSFFLTPKAAKKK